MRWIVAFIVLGAAAAIGWSVIDRLDAPEKRRAQRGPAAVSVAPIERASIAERRVYSGSLEAGARFVVSPKVAGRIDRLAVDLGDRVAPGQILAVLDDAEFEQAVIAARAELAVAEARLSEARSAAKIAGRTLERATTLRKRGVTSETQFDEATAEQLAAAAAVEVARAQVQRSRAALESARIRSGYTRVVARWPDRAPPAGADPAADSREAEEADAEGAEADVRMVARRLVDAGETVSAGTPLLSIVDLDPLVAVISVTERDYPNLKVGQPVSLSADAWPDRRFEGRVKRIAPAFAESARQARVEIEVPNGDRALRPGMFARVAITLRRIDDARVVPDAALTRRDESDGVFIVEGEPLTARWRPVRIGVREGDRVQIEGAGLTGRVVTLGQQLVDDGSPVVVPEGAGDR